MERYEMIIIGAGPSGMMTAITAAKRGKKVLLLEKNEKLGRKLMATGNGRCNLTNRNINVDDYHGANSSFIQRTLEKFDQDQTIAFFESLGVSLKEEGRGRIFPRTNQASTIVEALWHAMEEYGVTVRTNTTVKSIEKTNDFEIKTEKGETFFAEKLVLATGGKAAFQFGSSGDGIFWAVKLGHKIVPIYAALVPIETEEDWVKELQGVKVIAKSTVKIADKKISEVTGDILFTHFGLSGPAIMSQTGKISPLIDENTVNIYLDLYPEANKNDLDNKLEEIFKNNSKKNIKNALLGLFPAKLVPMILTLAEVNQDKNASEVSMSERSKIVDQIKSLGLTVKKVRPLKEAQVSRGGIDTTEIDIDTLGSKVVKNLYFVGEIMDVDGDSGGYNLQWAWASGYVAGQAK